MAKRKRITKETIIKEQQYLAVWSNRMCPVDGMYRVRESKKYAWCSHPECKWYEKKKN